LCSREFIRQGNDGFEMMERGKAKLGQRIGKFPAPLRVVILLLILGVCWVPIALPISWVVPDPNLQSLISLPILYLEFIALLQIWNPQVHGESKPMRRYGFRSPALNWLNLLSGLLIGWGAVLLLFVFLGEMGWAQWFVAKPNLPKIVAEALLISFALGFAEELLFRGWLLDELERDYSKTTATIASALVFALAHFLKPWDAIVASWLTFPALLILGLTLVWSKRSTRGRMGLAIGYHAGLVGGYYILNVGNLVKPIASVPSWLTGMNGNPLASVPGVLILGTIGLLVRGVNNRASTPLSPQRLVD
jgi:uncharacterized protein